jgi:hypothetical protein
VSVFSPLIYEVVQSSFPPAHGKENVVSYTPFQDFYVAPFHYSESEELLEELLDALDPSCYNKGDDVIENIDDFVHVGRHK